jgi:tetratricopeptide (TPR) repeat protein
MPYEEAEKFYADIGKPQKTAIDNMKYILAINAFTDKVALLKNEKPVNNNEIVRLRRQIILLLKPLASRISEETYSVNGNNTKAGIDKTGGIELQITAINLLADTMGYIESGNERNDMENLFLEICIECADKFLTKRYDIQQSIEICNRIYSVFHYYNTHPNDETIKKRKKLLEKFKKLAEKYINEDTVRELSIKYPDHIMDIEETVKSAFETIMSFLWTGNGTPARDIAISYCNAAQNSMENHNLDWAQKLSDSAIKTDPTYPEAYFVRGKIFSRMGKHIKAAKDFYKVTKMNTFNADAYHEFENSYNKIQKITPLIHEEAEQHILSEIDADNTPLFFLRKTILRDIISRKPLPGINTEAPNYGTDLNLGLDFLKHGAASLLNKTENWQYFLSFEDKEDFREALKCLDRAIEMEANEMKLVLAGLSCLICSYFRQDMAHLFTILISRINKISLDKIYSCLLYAYLLRSIAHFFVDENCFEAQDDIKYFNSLWDDTISKNDLPFERNIIMPPIEAAPYNEGGNYYDEIEYYKEYLRISPKNPEIFEKLGRIYFTLGDYKTADYYTGKAIELCGQFEKSSKEDANGLTPREYVLNFYFSGYSPPVGLLDELRKIQNDCEKIIEENSSIKIKEEPVVVYDEAKDYYNEINKFSVAIASGPESADAYRKRANAYVAIKNYFAAFAGYNEAVKKGKDRYAMQNREKILDYQENPSLGIDIKSLL